MKPEDPTNRPNITLNINGASLGPQALMSEVAWALRTGALPRPRSRWRRLLAFVRRHALR